VPTLDSVIAGCVDYIVGDAQALAVRIGDLDAGIMNTSGDTIRMQAEDVARDLETFGGFALQVIRGNGGGIAGIYHLPMQFVRTNKDCTVFYYSEEWSKFRQKALVYSAFIPGLEGKWAGLDENARKAHASSILFVKNDRTQVYPFPVYGAAVKACETERCIADFHLNGICNGFTASAIVNFNNGVPTDEIKDEIEQNFTEKFSGHGNSGRIMFSWNDDRTHATTFEIPKTEDLAKSILPWRSPPVSRYSPPSGLIPTSLASLRKTWDSARRNTNRPSVFTTAPALSPSSRLSAMPMTASTGLPEC
jgi:hypothetical protein